ncbi:MAG: hypothetical protein K2G32_10885 [Oscillospiraceae bacterium]|nr:hypothetical protein [Oscillospiraceae bacterium]
MYIDDVSYIDDFRYEFEKFYQLVLLYMGVIKSFPRYYYSDQDRAVYEKRCVDFVDELQKIYMIPDIITNAGREIQTNLQKTVEA